MSKDFVQIEGFVELEQKIKQLANDKDKRREVFAILNNAANTVSKAAKGFAPESDEPHLISGKRARQVINPGNLKRSIGKFRGKKGASKRNPTVYVGPKVKGKHLGFYGAWVHNGHNVYKPGKKRNRAGNANANAGLSKKVTRPQPFMQKAYNTTKGKVAAEVEKQTARFIQRRINRLSK